MADKRSSFSDRERELAELLSKIARKCESALNRVYELTISHVYGLALKIITKPSEADEVALDVFKQVWDKAGDYNDMRGTPSAWLMTITRSRSIDKIRSTARWRNRTDNLDELVLDPDDVPQPNPAPDEIAEIRQKREIIDQALSMLSPYERESIELAYFYGMSQSEISSHMNKPLGTVKSWIRSGMAKLRTTLVPARAE